ncbi:MAG TPA: DUF6782 family putative metallopeptidase [Labilithrix sp.]|nr:DUF6782 family putative metallopeptidase [Labilithrix sp.]
MKRSLSIVLALAATACSGSKQASNVARAEAPRPAPLDVTDAGAPPASDGADPEATASLTSKESKAVARTLARISELRGVKAMRPVPGVVLGRDKLVARVKDKALREFPSEALTREGQVLQLFGFAPPTFDYLNEMMTLLEAQLEGFYEPKNGTMYLAADLRGKEAQATLAHELVHALQDQTWDLKSRSSYRPGKGDETVALACLAEGDATSAMMDFVMREQGRTALDLPDDMLRELMAAGMNGPSIANVPHILRSTLISPYIDGLAFVHALRKKGGFPMVDRAWQTPPTTTEQVLHVEKWEAHEPALAIEAPSARALGAGWNKDDEDTMGELGLALAFEEWIDHADARRAAAGWGGDRSAVYTKGDEIAFAVHSRYDAVVFAERAMQKLGPGLKKTLGTATIDTPDAVCFERKALGPLLVARKARDFVLAAGPARTGKTTWTTASTCAEVKKWADEILAAK